MTLRSATLSTLDRIAATHQNGLVEKLPDGDPLKILQLAITRLENEVAEKKKQAADLRLKLDAMTIRNEHAGTGVVSLLSGVWRRFWTKT